MTSSISSQDVLPVLTPTRIISLYDQSPYIICGGPKERDFRLRVVKEDVH